ncbi:MAG TPA: GDP-mannose 4,6-dehydratase, partial [Nitrolancea sp.]|nr:GDP-mannose 4,6-dehydratase [Nitrolancea sp.]
DGHSVIAVDNLVTGRAVNIEHLQGHELFTFIQHDVTVPLEIQVDQIYHLASPASPIGYMTHPIETHLVNSIGTLNLLRLAEANQARLLFTSTSEAYGDPLVHPQSETYFGNVNPVGPRSCYDESKRFGESITMEFVRHFGVDARIVRLFNTYGPRSDPEDGRVVPNFVMRALSGEPLPVYGDGEQTRSLCYVSDIIGGLRRTMESSDAGGEVINLGNPDERTILELAHFIIEMTGSTSDVSFEPARPDDPDRRCPDTNKARTLLGWEPIVPIEDGLRETIAYLSRYRSRTSRALASQ